MSGMLFVRCVGSFSFGTLGPFVFQGLRIFFSQTWESEFETEVASGHQFPGLHSTNCWKKWLLRTATQEFRTRA